MLSFFWWIAIFLFQVELQYFKVNCNISRWIAIFLFQVDLHHLCLIKSIHQTQGQGWIHTPQQRQINATKVPWCRIIVYSMKYEHYLLCCVLLWLYFHWSMFHVVNTLRPRQNGHHFANNIFKCIFMDEKFYILLRISLKFVPKGSIENKPALVQLMAWCWPGDNNLSEPMLI